MIKVVLFVWFFCALVMSFFMCIVCFLVCFVDATVCRFLFFFAKDVICPPKNPKKNVEKKGEQFKYLSKLERILETAPQLLLQSYVMFRRQEFDWLSLISIAVSFVSLSSKVGCLLFVFF